VARTRKFFAVAACTAAVLGVGAGAALAGEVKGPPGSAPVPGGNQNVTGGPAHANSACVFNGLNDFDSREGQNSFHVQAYGIDVAGKGDPADPHEFNPGDACRGGSN
jgi:hypothetical protein